MKYKGQRIIHYLLLSPWSEKKLISESIYTSIGEDAMEDRLHGTGKP